MLIDCIHKFAHLAGDGMQHGVVRYEIKGSNAAADFSGEQLVARLIDIKCSSQAFIEALGF